MARGERFVVTGGAGFVGSHLCEALLDSGAEVVCLDNLSTGRVSNLERCLESARFSFVECDVVEPFDVDGRVDGVVHLASPASPMDYQADPIGTLEVGSVGTLRVLRLAEAKAARLVYASTSEVYGDPLVHPQVETYWGNVNPIGPRSMYDEAKRFGEAAVAAFRHERDVNAGIVRIFNTFGPRMRPHDGRAIPTFISQALAGDPLTVTGSGGQTRSICFVSDLVDGLRAMLASDHPGPINLGNPHEISMSDLARWICTLSGSASELRFIESPGDDPKVRRPDIGLARDVLGWEPRVEAEEGLRRTIDWFRVEELGDAAPLSLIDPDHEPLGTQRAAGLRSAR
jgi:dTDP-glucose 4,6-dehydratase